MIIYEHFDKSRPDPGRRDRNSECEVAYCNKFGPKSSPIPLEPTRDFVADLERRLGRPGAGGPLVESRRPRVEGQAMLLMKLWMG